MNAYRQTVWYDLAQIACKQLSVTGRAGPRMLKHF